MVSSKINSLIQLFCRRSIAGPDKTPWVAQAITSVAPPLSIKACALLHNVPAVSTISSIKITFFPRTSPIMFITSDTFAFWRRLSTIAKGQPNLVANVLARVTEPRSGDTATYSSTLSPMRSFK